MTNPYSGIISAAHKELFNNLIDALLEDAALTYSVEFIYNSTTYIDCSQCQASTIGNKPATGGLTGAPIPIGSNSLCPSCHGTNKVPYIPPSETYKIAVVTDYRKFINFKPPLDRANSYIQTICRRTLMPKLSQVKEIIICSDSQQLAKHRFEKVADFSPEGFGDPRYIFGTWCKI